MDEAPKHKSEKGPPSILAYTQILQDLMEALNNLEGVAVAQVNAAAAFTVSFEKKLPHISGVMLMPPNIQAWTPDNINRSIQEIAEKVQKALKRADTPKILVPSGLQANREG